MTTESVTWDLVARDRASATVGRVGGSVESLTRRVTHLAGAFGAAFVAEKLKNFAEESVKLYADAQSSQLKLEDAYKRFPAIADVRLAALRRLNAAEQARTGADHNALAAAEATLAQYRLTGEQIRRLTPLVVDYAEKTGQDVPTSASLLGRALLGNARALKAIGVNFKATGNTTKDFNTLVDALNQKVGGFGEQYGKTAAGQAKILGAEFHDLQERVGKDLLPAMLSLGRFLNRDLIPALEDTAKWGERNKSWIEPVGIGLGSIAVAVKTIKLARGALDGLGKVPGLGSVATKTTPIPVYVTNWHGGPGAVGGTVAKDAEHAAEGGAAAAGARAALKRFGLDVFTTTRALQLPLTATYLATAGGDQAPYNARVQQANAGAIGSMLETLIRAFNIRAGSEGRDLPTSVSDAANKRIFSGATDDPHGLKVNVPAAVAYLAKYGDPAAVARLQQLATIYPQVAKALHGVATGQRRANDALDGSVAATRRAMGAGQQYQQQLDALPARLAAEAATFASVGRQLGAIIDKSIADGIGAYASVPASQAQVIAAQVGKAARFGAMADNPGAGAAGTGALTPKIRTPAVNVGKAAAAAVVSGYKPAVTSGVSNATSAAFDKARQIMETDLGNFKSYLSSQRQTIFSAFSGISTTATDSLGASGRSSVLGQLNADRRLADQFTRLYIRLDDAGATPRVLDMFEGLGPAAIPTMRLWLSHPRKLRQANRDLRRVGADAARVGERATEDRYGPILHRDLEKLPHKLEQSLMAALRHLNITIDVSGHAKRRARAVRAS